jgi:membrane protein CcdC involved in cytochrome C biogenesis
MLCYIYCDYFHLFVPGYLESLIQGKSLGGPISPAKLVAFAVMMSIPALMVALSLILPSRWSRVLNIAFGILYTLIMIAVASMSIGEWYIFYSYFAVIEIALSVTITILAWRWPKTV